MASYNYIVKVIGVGGGGVIPLKKIVEKDPPGLEYVAIDAGSNTMRNFGHRKIILAGRGDRGFSEVPAEEVKKLTLDKVDSIADAMKGADMAIIMAGMGGQTGSVVAPIVAKVARDMNILSVVIASRPFPHEGAERLQTADRGLAETAKFADSVVLLPNNQVVEIVGPRADFSAAQAKSDKYLLDLVCGFSDSLFISGLIPVEINQLRAIFRLSGFAHFGIGAGSGNDPYMEAVTEALRSPFMDGRQVARGRGVFASILTRKIAEYKDTDRIYNALRGKLGEERDILIGAVTNAELPTKVQVILFSTGWHALPKSAGRAQRGRPAAQRRPQDAQRRQRKGRGDERPEDRKRDKGSSSTRTGGNRGKGSRKRNRPADETRKSASRDNKKRSDGRDRDRDRRTSRDRSRNQDSGDSSRGRGPRGR